MTEPSTRRFSEALRTGAFVTRERARLWAIAVLTASLIGLLYVCVTAHGMVDFKGRPLGTDFSLVYSAGTLVLEGQPAAAFDPDAMFARERTLFGDQTPLYTWIYPPIFLGPAAALALLPYWLALFAWQAATLVGYLAALGALLRFCGVAGDRLWLLLAVGFPAVFVNIGHGHNGFLTAALLSGALVLLDRRPLVAGVLFGLIAYKPQFGLVIPLVLIATGRWRTFAAAAATVAALVLAVALAFGPDIWPTFLMASHATRIVVLEAGDTGWHKIQSVFAWARMWGADVPLAYALQGMITVAVAAAVTWLWRTPAAFAQKAAALAIATILASPYSLDYDMMVLAPAIAFLAADGMVRGFLSYEKTALAALWMVPLIARAVAQAALIPIGVIAMLAMFGLIIRRQIVAPGLGTADPAPHFGSGRPARRRQIAEAVAMLKYVSGRSRIPLSAVARLLRGIERTGGGPLGLPRSAIRWPGLIRAFEPWRSAPGHRLADRLHLAAMVAETLGPSIKPHRARLRSLLAQAVLELAALPFRPLFARGYK
jgi:glycosyl transferase family 87